MPKHMELLEIQYMIQYTIGLSIFWAIQTSMMFNGGTDPIRFGSLLKERFVRLIVSHYSNFIFQFYIY